MLTTGYRPVPLRVTTFSRVWLAGRQACPHDRFYEEPADKDRLRGRCLVADAMAGTAGETTKGSRPNQCAQNTRQRIGESAGSGQRATVVDGPLP
jgi:hypothetical protein